MQVRRHTRQGCRVRPARSGGAPPGGLAGETLGPEGLITRRRPGAILAGLRVPDAARGMAVAPALSSASRRIGRFASGVHTTECIRHRAACASTSSAVSGFRPMLQYAPRQKSFRLQSEGAAIAERLQCRHAIRSNYGSRPATTLEGPLQSRARTHCLAADACDGRK